jgi:hypothetical protein
MRVINRERAEFTGSEQIEQGEHLINRESE